MTQIASALSELDPNQKYVLAVSGGVDSMTLLYLFAGQFPKSNLMVAHFDHKMRPGSDLDSQFVNKTANSLDIAIRTEETVVVLKKEEEARNSRYDFLSTVKKEFAADFIVTAHHQD